MIRPLIVDWIWYRKEGQRGGELVFFCVLKFSIVFTVENGIHITPGVSFSALNFSFTFGLWDHFLFL